MTRDDMLTLEQILDRTNMRTILVALSEIAGKKESHARQDETLAKAWRKAELQLDRLACNMSM